MSSYLNFYLVPKKVKKKFSFSEESENNEIEEKLTEGKPLLFMSYSRNSGIYSAYNELLNPPFIGVKEDEFHSMDLSKDNAEYVVNEFTNDVNRIKKRLEVSYKILKESGYSSELWEEIQSMEEYLEEENETLTDLKYIALLVSKIDGRFTDFEKIIINID